MTVAAAAIGLIGGTEIGMITLAAVARFRWKRAWLATVAALLTFIPILALLYLFFTSLPVHLVQFAAGAVILLLGAYFFYEGMKKRSEKGVHEEKIAFHAGLVGVYAAILVEEAEEGSIAMAIGAAGGSYISAVLGMTIGILIPLFLIRSLKPFVEKLPEWAVQVTVGIIMMAVASLIIIFNLRF